MDSRAPPRWGSCGRTGARALSPVVGGVLLLGVVLLLAVSVAAMAFGLVGAPQPAPEVVLEAEPAGDGIGIYLHHGAGDQLDERTRLTGVVDENAIAADPPLESGERIYVVPTDDEIDVIWEGPDADHKLATVDDFAFDVADPVRDTIDDVVDSDPKSVGCEWVDEQKASGGQIDIEDRIVTCEFETDEAVVMKGDSMVVGGVDAETVDVKDRGVVVGDVSSDDDAILEDEAVVVGEVTGDVAVKAEADVYGDLASETDLEVKDGAAVDGTIESELGVTLKPDVVVAEDVLAGAGVVLDGSDIRVDGSIDADDDVTIKDGGEIGGDVASGGTVVLKNDVTIHGDVSAEAIECDGSGSTIAGEDCEEYD